MRLTEAFSGCAPVMFGQSHESHPFPPPVRVRVRDQNFFHLLNTMHLGGTSSPRCHRKQSSLIVISPKWSSQLRQAYISKGASRPFSLMCTHSHSLMVGTPSTHWARLAHVRYCTTRNMTTQVSSIPPIMKYLSWKALFSMSRITVLDKPSMLAISRIFF